MNFIFNLCLVIIGTIFDKYFWIRGMSMAPKIFINRDFWIISLLNYLIFKIVDVIFSNYLLSLFACLLLSIPLCLGKQSESHVEQEEHFIDGKFIAKLNSTYFNVYDSCYGCKSKIIHYSCYSEVLNTTYRYYLEPFVKLNSSKNIWRQSRSQCRECLVNIINKHPDFRVNLHKDPKHYLILFDVINMEKILLIKQFFMNDIFKIITLFLSYITMKNLEKNKNE